MIAPVETSSEDVTMNMVAPGVNDSRFVLPTLDEDGLVDTLDRAMPKFPSKRTGEEFEGIALRNCVVPVMMPHMEKVAAMMNFRPDMKSPLERPRNRVIALIGAPGVGKTTAAQVTAEQYGGTLYNIPCNGTEISELISETTVDGNAKWSTLEHDVNDRIKSGRMKPSTLAVIKETFKGMLNEDGTINFANVPEDIKYDSYQRAERLQKVAEWEGIISHGHLISKVPGPLYKALKAIKESKVPVVINLDEYARRRDVSGGDPRLYEILTGSRTSMDETVTVTGAQGESFELSNADLLKNGTVVFINGNHESAVDDEIKPMPPALKSRVATTGIEDIQQRDWAHRTQQILADVPLSTLYEAQKDLWNGTNHYENEKEDYGQYLLDVLVRGRSEDQIKNIPAAQFSFLGNWERFKDGTEQFAGFMHDLQLMEDPKSSLYSDENIEKQPLLQNLQNDVTTRPAEHPAHNLELTLRLAKEWVEEAMTEVSMKRTKGQKPQMQKARPAAMEEEFGTRLVNIIRSKMNQLYPPTNQHNQHIREYIDMLMHKHGIFTPETKKPLSDEAKELLATADGPDVRSTDTIIPISTLLNTPREQGKDARVKEWQEIIALYIQHQYPDHFEKGVTIKPESVISYSAVKDMLDKQTPGIQTDLDAHGHIPLPLIPALEVVPPEPGASDSQFALKIAMQNTFNTKMNAQDMERMLEGLGSDLRAPVEASWKRLAKGGKDSKEQSDPNALRLLMTLALPNTAKDIIPRLFPTVKELDDEEMLKMAVGAPNQSNLAITTFQSGLDADGKPEMVQLMVRFEDEPGRGGKPERAVKRAVIIGNGNPIPAKLSQMLSDAGNVAYISRKDPNARAQIQNEVDEMLRLGELSREKALREKYASDPTITSIAKPEAREKRINDRIKSDQEFPVSRDMQAAITFTTTLSMDYIQQFAEKNEKVKQQLKQYNELPPGDGKDRALNFLIPLAFNEVVNSEKISLTDMLYEGDKMFTLDKPMMLMQNKLPKHKG